MVAPVLASVPPSSACTETDLLALFTGNCSATTEFAFGSTDTDLNAPLLLLSSGMSSCVSPSVIWSDCATGSCPMAMQQLPKQTEAVKTVSIIFIINFTLDAGYGDRRRFVCRGESLNFSLGFRRTSP